MNSSRTLSCPHVRRTVPAVTARSACPLDIAVFSTLFKPTCYRPYTTLCTPVPIRGVYTGKTVLPYILKTRYKFHPC